jgi:apoptosis-inducing factor 3
MTDPAKSAVADFASGVAIAAVPDEGMIQGKLNGEDVILARRGSEFFAVGAACPYYGGPLVKGLITGDELRCPLHHACFSLRTGEVLRAPALDSLACWRVERSGDLVFVREKLAPRERRHSRVKQPPASIVIVGGGGAGLAAADTLRREGYEGSLTIISADDSAPYDRCRSKRKWKRGLEAPYLNPPESVHDPR